MPKVRVETLENVGNEDLELWEMNVPVECRGNATTLFF